LCAPNLALRAVDIVLISFGVGINTPSLTSLVSRAALADEQGGTLGVYQSMASLARATGPFWAGWIYDVLGHTAPFYSAAIVIALGWLFLGFPLLRGRIPQPQAALVGRKPSEGATMGRGP